MPFTAKSYSCGNQGQVRKLIDLNHGNWVNVPVPEAQNTLATLLDIETSTTDGNHVFAVGEAKEGIGAIPSFMGVAVSTDGGVTWNIPGGNYQLAPLANLGAGDLFQWNEIVVVGTQNYGVSGTSYIVGTAYLATRLASIAKSTDGGATYNLIGAAPIGDWVNLLPGPQQALRATYEDKHGWSVHFDGNVGVVGLENFVLKTTNAGGAWLMMNDGLPLSTATAPNPPGTILPIGPITGIHIKADQSQIVGVGEEFIISSVGVAPTAGEGPDSWRNNSFTSGGGGAPPVFEGFTINQHIGRHLGGFTSPDDAKIWITGDNALGMTSLDNMTASYQGGWANLPGNPTQRAAHFYKQQTGSWYGLFCKNNNVWHTVAGFQGFGQVISDAVMNYTPEAIWTWYEETPECYLLTDCSDPGNTIISNSGWLANYIGQVVTIAEQSEHCFVVSLSQSCTTAISLTYTNDYPNCISCAPPPEPCACPPGTIEVTLPNGQRVCRQDIITPAETHDTQTGCDMIAAVIGCPDCNNGNFNPNTGFNQYGAKFYQNISPRPWPITPYIDPSCTTSLFYFRDNSAALVGVTNNPVSALWGDGSSTSSGRHNNAAVWSHFWNPTTCPANPISGLYGFTHCLTVASQDTYFFATSGRNFRLKINGTIAVENLSGTDFGTRSLHVFPITLAPGTYILEMTGAEIGTSTCNTVPPSTTGFVWEIYNGVGLTSASLSAMTTTLQLSAVTVYSTLNESGNNFDYGTVTFNNRCPIGQALDNCFANVLNPLANPNIYVCHQYIDTPVQGCCYVLQDCQNPNITYLTSTDLSIYVFLNQVIKVAEYQGCFTVLQAVDCGVVLPPTVTVLSSHADCQACLPVCYILQPCTPGLPVILTSTDLSGELGNVVTIAGSTTCYTVLQGQSCQGAIQVVLTGSYSDCTECLPTCYLLTNCLDSTDTKVTSTDLSQYLNTVIYIDGCPGVCYQVSTAPDCTGAIQVTVNNNFADCPTCLNVPPPPPVELKPRAVKPGYYTKACSIEYTEKVHMNFAKAMYDHMAIKRFGIQMCCNEPIEKWAIKKELLEFKALYDPDLCVNTFEICCPPCAVVAEIVMYRTLSCNPPTNVDADLVVPIPVCPAPTGPQATITVSTVPCVCYYITLTGDATFSYTDCAGASQTVTLAGSGYICSQTAPAYVSGSGSDINIQTTPGDCALGTCGFAL